MKITTIGVDLAKAVFQIHAADKFGRKVHSRKLRRTQMLAYFVRLEPCKVAMEACGSAHYWGRKLTELGHEVMLIAPQYVKPYVRGDKTDAAGEQDLLGEFSQCDGGQRRGCASLQKRQAVDGLIMPALSLRLNQGG